MLDFEPAECEHCYALVSPLRLAEHSRSHDFDEVNRLRAVVEDAPHKCDCSWPWESDEPNPDGWECNCWKAGAL